MQTNNYLKGSFLNSKPQVVNQQITGIVIYQKPLAGRSISDIRFLALHKSTNSIPTNNPVFYSDFSEFISINIFPKPAKYQLLYLRYFPSLQKF